MFRSSKVRIIKTLPSIFCILKLCSIIFLLLVYTCRSVNIVRKRCISLQTIASTFVQVKFFMVLHQIMGQRCLIWRTALYSCLLIQAMGTENLLNSNPQGMILPNEKKIFRIFTTWIFKSLLRKSYSICFEFLYRIHEAIVNEEDGEVKSYLLDLDFRYVRQYVYRI